MNAFLSKLELTPLPDGRNWELIENFTYCTDAASDGDILTIPQGFITDLASVPRILWNIYPPFGKYTEAAVLHDYGYRTGGNYPGATKPYSKRDVDNLFRDAMKICGVGAFSRFVLYQAVSKFGKGSFLRR